VGGDASRGCFLACFGVLHTGRYVAIPVSRWGGLVFGTAVGIKGGAAYVVGKQKAGGRDY